MEAHPNARDEFLADFNAAAPIAAESLSDTVTQVLGGSVEPACTCHSEVEVRRDPTKRVMEFTVRVDMDTCKPLSSTITKITPDGEPDLVMHVPLT